MDREIMKAGFQKAFPNPDGTSHGDYVNPAWEEACEFAENLQIEKDIKIVDKYWVLGNANCQAKLRNQEKENG